MAQFSAAIAAVSAASPMGSGSVPVVRSRTLLVDGDGLAYYCAGSTGTSAGEARASLVDKVRSAQRLVGAANVCVMLTASDSNKGHRYAIARVKPYQGQRVNSRRPDNWQALRDYMNSVQFPFPVHSTSFLEADDLIAAWAYRDPEGVVIYTQDKDMRMLPGMHLNWVSHRLHTVRPGEDSVFNDQQYGVKWFWLQMLQGDQADNIPGLPRYVTQNAHGKQVLKPVGEVTAAKMLADATTSGDCFERVYEQYLGYYGDRAIVEMLEQAALLWLRRKATWLDCACPDGPMSPALLYRGYDIAVQEINDRIDNANSINAKAAEVNGDSDSAGEPSGEAGPPL